MSGRIAVRYLEPGHAGFYQNNHSFELDYPAIASLIKKQKSIAANLEVLKHGLKHDESSPTALALEALESDLLEVQTHVEKLWDTVPVSRRLLDISTTASEAVFDTPELLEHILSLTNPNDLLKAMQVNRNWRGTFEGSAKLQTRLGLRAVDHSNYCSPLALSCGSSWLCRWPSLRYAELSYHGDDPNALNIYKHGYRDKPSVDTMNILVDVEYFARLPHLGSRSREIQICSPMPLTMTVVPKCSSCFGSSDPWTHDEGPEEVIDLQKPLTVGTVLDMTAKHRNKHASCKRSNIKHPRFPALYFKLAVPLQEYDPIRKRRQAHSEAGKVVEDEGGYFVR